MPDKVTRVRLRKKVLDRWENEGGRICVDVNPDANNRRPGEEQNEQTVKSSTDSSAEKKEDRRGS